MIPVINKRIRRWSYYCQLATSWTWDIGSYYWYMYP